ncbi:alpha/beta fold hydrolase BchO [Palleronia sp. LCG004]|uniref:alpha/beta fold hydrolase BchO n=1 Tax=Palleronia sp. LCG004 TaxID=3079304 RepID=UPI00294393F9|nr:alpha/beta fold hydrolase BchO [Palleronia sp. LCG004]WOI56332.1 alpha/beta fold hydrolase [Palleronia sp. LCG004]
MPADWPHRDVSRRVESRPHLWHMQEKGSGPVLLLLHGTGASTHSWAGLFDRLAEAHRVVAVDLPGHGFTRLGSRHRSRPALMAADLWSLLGAEDIAPRAIIGHSAGAALALEMATSPERNSDVALIIGINAALSAFDGAAGWLFPMAARAMAAMPGLTTGLARLARSNGRVEQLLGNTGSMLDTESIARYRVLLGDPTQIDGALSMMAQWSTRGFDDEVRRYPGRLTLLTGERDATVSPAISARAARIARDGVHLSMGPYGHLVHEEAADMTASVVLDTLSREAVPIAR